MREEIRSAEQEGYARSAKLVTTLELFRSATDFTNEVISNRKQEEWG